MGVFVPKSSETHGKGHVSSDREEGARFND